MPWNSEPGAIDVPRRLRPSAAASLLKQSLAFALLLKPREHAAPLPMRGFVFAAAVMLAAHYANDAAIAGPDALPNLFALGGYALYVLLALAIGAVGAVLIDRPKIALRYAALMLLATLPAQLAIGWFDPRWSYTDEPANDAARLAFGTYGTFVVLRVSAWIAGSYARAFAPTALAAGLTLAALMNQPLLPWWWQVSDGAGEEADYAFDEPAFDAEAVMYAQRDQVDAALARLAPQRPDAIDLYAVGFGGDGEESVFRNEVEYFATLMEQRFGAAGRTLRLINHPDTVERDPLATLTNLRHALAGIGERIDRDEDVLLLFLTSHGSDDHQLYVSLDPLPLNQITPDDLRDALDDAGIRWRVLVVSACYSGGFIDALESPETLVITAARADRPSFGCGTQSELTWFGQAFLTEALNETGDFADAFDIAKDSIREREREEGEDPSHPQIDAGETIAAQLQRWQAQTTLGDRVKFVPAVPADPSNE